MTPNKIVIHHTWVIDSTDAWVEANHRHRSRWESISKMWSHIFYHFTIQKDWTRTQHRQLDERSRATKNNNDSINISLHWNFNEEYPTEEQYATTRTLIQAIRQKKWPLLVYWHWELEWEATSCPGKNFSINQISTKSIKEQESEQIQTPTPTPTPTPTVKQKEDPRKLAQTWPRWTYLWKFRLTQYYSPTADQTNFAFSHELWRRRTQREEITMQCWRREELSASENARSCQHPANWMTYIDEHAKHHWACPRQFPLEKKLWIEWPEWWWWFVCVDRWGMINWNKLDIRAWYWNEWLKRIEEWLLWIPQYADVYSYNPSVNGR